MFLGEVLLLQSGHDKIAKSTIFRFNWSYFFLNKKGNTGLQSLRITRRLMLIDICFMKIS